MSVGASGMFRKILIANRGEIACRVIRTARRMGIATVAVHSDADRDALHVRMADEAVRLGPPPAGQSYLDIGAILEAVRRTGAEAVHPGYGFLAENPKFALALEEAGVAFIGPPVGAIEAMGDKITSKKLAAEAGVSTIPGHMGVVETAEEAVGIAREIGYPVMIKASAGGGGKGMRIAWDDDEVREGFQSSKNEAASSFGDDRVFIEKFVTSPRHIEIQVLGDRHGHCIHLGERECSIQRRNQKVIEEAPSPFLDAETRAAMGAQAVALAQAVGYVSAGTVEFVVDAERNFYFLEMNTRLQVEHPVTELVTGIDLVEQMIRVAAGEELALAQADVRLDGWAIECRLYAEDPYRKFLPSIGRLTRYRPPRELDRRSPLPEPDDARSDDDQQEHLARALERDLEIPPRIVRNDTGVYEGGEISMFYDPMIAKLCTWGPDRDVALETMREALDAFEVEGIGHNLPFLAAVIDHPRFIAGDITTGFIAEEFPEGFSGVTLSEDTLCRIAAVAVIMRAILERRAAQISGTMANHEREVGENWVVSLGGIEAAARYWQDEGWVFIGDRKVDVSVRWRPEDTLAYADVDHSEMILKVDRRTEGFRIRYRGGDLEAHVRTPRAAELARLMPEKRAADTSKLLLCPMPGVVVSIKVEEGQEVQEGQPLAVVEAMKMENVLRAERKAVVKKINAAPGASLSVDEVIMEFE